MGVIVLVCLASLQLIVISPRFGNDLQIAEKLFIMDAGASNSKDMKLLRNLLLELRNSIISVRVFCFSLVIEGVWFC